jgi:hypothetical protein
MGKPPKKNLPILPPSIFCYIGKLSFRFRFKNQLQNWNEVTRRLDLTFSYFPERKFRTGANRLWGL